MFCSPSQERVLHQAIVPGAIVASESSSDTAFARLAEWMKMCREKHNLCKNERTAPLPTRVIEIGLLDSCKPRLLDSGGREGTTQL